ncbi:hypothetical protein HYC85_030697 [Camellia sinensis]|uniref:Uncharacterized protein n=1 Tax=Camellia sinensis TaxID=4442 RepID=A0A7J7G5G0_CAMSI|nr:hypothetical protein HYC85_030697 [Camellia sinensis]
MADDIPQGGAPPGMEMDPEFKLLPLSVRPFDPATYQPEVHVLPPDSIRQFRSFAQGAPLELLLREPELHLSYGAAEIQSRHLNILKWGNLGNPDPVPKATCPSSPELSRLGSLGLLPWMLGDTTGWVKLPPALRCCHRHKIEAVGREKIAGRHLTLPVGRVFLQNLQPTATEDKAKHGSTFQGIYAPTMSLIIVMTRRDMCLGSRTTNHAFPCMMAQRTKLTLGVEIHSYSREMARSGKLTLVDDALLGSLDVVRSVQMREWNILICSRPCFALGLIPRCVEDVRAFCPFAVITMTSKAQKRQAKSTVISFKLLAQLAHDRSKHKSMKIAAVSFKSVGITGSKAETDSKESKKTNAKQDSDVRGNTPGITRLLTKQD